MNSKVEELKARFQEQMAAVQDAEGLEKLRIAFLGKKGFITDVMKSMRDMNEDERREMGKYMNEFKTEVTRELAEEGKKLQAKIEAEKLKRDVRYDISLPCESPLGTLHPITIVQRELEEIFSSMGAMERTAAAHSGSAWPVQ